MYVLYSSEPLVLERVRDALPAGEHGIATESWQELTEAAPRANYVLIAMRWLSDDACTRLRLAVSGDLDVPIVLITTRDADNARAALRSGATCIVWLEDMRRELHACLPSIRTTPTLERIGESLSECARLNELLRVALCTACRAEVPVLSVGALAALLQRDRRTLWRHWHYAVAESKAHRLEDFLDWIVLIRATHQKVPTWSWARVAHALGTNQHTLARIAARLTGMTLSELAMNGHRNLEERFLERAVRPLLGPADKLG